MIDALDLQNEDHVFDLQPISSSGLFRSFKHVQSSKICHKIRSFPLKFSP